MKNATFHTFASLLEDAGFAIARVVRFAARSVATMSWPALLACCVLLALAISLLPLALFLFVVFMAIKLVAAAVVINTRRHGQRSPQHRP